MDISSSLANLVGDGFNSSVAWPSLTNNESQVGDAELLELYCVAKSRPALAAIVRRYAPLVASVVRRILSNPQDSEDAFQATFLVLMVSAQRIRNRDSLAPWLYGVAFRTAKRVRQLRIKSNAKMKNQSETGVEPDLAVGDAEEPLAIIARELQLEAMDEELSRLPQHLRDPLIEHYLSGITVPEIAKVLNLSVSAVEGRLKRGRRELRSRLAIRGISLSVVAAACLRFQKEVAAASAEPWTERFLESYGSNFDPTAYQVQRAEGDLATDSHLFKLINGELTMKHTIKPVFAGALVALSILTVGSLSVLNAGASHDGNSNQGGQQKVAVVELRSSDVFESDGFVTYDSSAVLAQQKASVPTAGTSQGAATGGGGVPAAGGVAAGAGTSAPAAPAPKPEPPIKWTKPTEPPPYWLTDETEAETLIVEERIRKSLNRRMEAEFNGIPLTNVMKFFSDECNIHILVDSKALEEENITPEEPITYQSPQRKMRDILTQILAPLNLVYTIDRETVVITSRNSEKGAIRYYDLSYILPDDSLLPDLIELIENTIEPDTWSMNGGVDTINYLGSMLIVRTCEENHCEIEKMLRSISKQTVENLKRRSTRPSRTREGSGGGMGGGMGGGGMM